MAEREEALVVYEVDSCVKGDYYDRGAVFDDFNEAVAAIRRELAEGRLVMIERSFMTRAEFDAFPELPEDGTLGQRTL